MTHDPKTIASMTVWERMHYVRSNSPNWSPIKMDVTTTQGKPATLMADANGDISLWSKTDGYTGSLNINLYKDWPW